jgi:aconitase B
VAKGAPKALVDKLGLTPYLKDSKSLYEVISKYTALLVQIGFLKDKEIILENHENGDIDVKLRGNCPYMNACQALSKEGVYDIFGNIACARTLIFAGIAEAILSRSYDTKVRKYNPPDCEVKVFEV